MRHKTAFPDPDPEVQPASPPFDYVLLHVKSEWGARETPILDPGAGVMSVPGADLHPICHARPLPWRSLVTSLLAKA